MFTRRRTVGAMAFAAVVMLPRTGSADVIDMVWKISGPNLFTVPLLSAEYRIGLEGPRKKSFSITDIRVKGPSERIDLLSEKESRSWLALNGGVYISSGHKPKENGSIDYAFDEVKMFAFTPMYQYVWCRCHGNPVYSGAGVAVETFFGTFPTFTKVPLKLRLASVMIRDTLDVGVDVRFYSSRPTAAEFGKIVPDSENALPEWSLGFNVGLPWRKR